MKRIACLPPAALEDLLPTEIERRSERRDYWVLDHCYVFGGDAVASVLVPAAEDLWAMCRDFVGIAVEDERILSSLGIPALAWDAVRRSWRKGDPVLFARFDLSFDGAAPPKLHECNIDIAGHVHEAEYFQRRWFAAQTAATGWRVGQFAGLGPAIAAEARFRSAGLPIRFLCIGDDPYDALNVQALQHMLSAEGVDWQVDRYAGPDDYVRCTAGEGAAPRFGIKNFRWDHFIGQASPCPRLEAIAEEVTPPLWTLVLSSKGCLPWLWALNPGHPNLLAAHFDPRHLAGARGIVSKPLLSVRGRDIILSDRAAGHAVGPADLPESEKPRVYQELHYLPRAEGAGRRPWASTGVFIVGDKAVAMTMTEADSPIVTGDANRTVPHVLV